MRNGISGSRGLLLAEVIEDVPEIVRRRENNVEWLGMAQTITKTRNLNTTEEKIFLI